MATPKPRDKPVNSPTTDNKEDVKIESKTLKRKPSEQWLSNVYKEAFMSNEDLLGIYDLIKYKGFDRDEVLAQLEDKIPSPKLAAEAIMACSQRGPVQAEKIILSNGKSLRQMGIPASGQKGGTGLSCQRISAATADLAAWLFKRIGVPKRILSSTLPGWLQFPTAGSIQMPADLRALHIEFSKEFSKLIGGVFNEQIYAQMMANAYLDPKLNLFN